VTPCAAEGAGEEGRRRAPAFLGKVEAVFLKSESCLW